jgi:hypothetical protein
MMPVLQAEASLSMVDALMVTSEHTGEENRGKLVARLTALAKGRMPDGVTDREADGNPNRYPGVHLHGGAQVRAWLTMRGGFRKNQIQE